MNYKNISKIISGVLACTMFLYTTPVLAYTKDETVYTKVDSKGEQYKTIVSTHLKNTENEEILNDISDLIDIENTNGDETFEKDGNSIIWKANSNDIYYQGESSKELPIECNIKYELNGEEIDAKEIAGKEGTINITLTYTNKDEHIVNINGKNEKLYTPFVVVAGTIIKNENNKEVKVTNGKVIDDGTKTIVLGMAFPGLQESLDISKDTIDIPNTIEISMNTTNFEMGNIMNFVTSKVIETDDIDIFNDIEKLYSKVGTLQSSSKQIEEGAKSLKEGTEQYSEKMQEFENAMKQMQNGMSSANLNYTKINEGITNLNTSSKQLNSGAKSVSDGVSQIEKSLNTVNEKMSELLSGSQTIEKGTKELSQGIEEITSKLDKINLTDNSSKIKELETLIKTNESTITSLKNTNTALQNKYDSETDEAIKTSIKAQISGNEAIIKLLQTNIAAEKETISTLQLTDSTAITELKTGLNKLKTGLSNISLRNRNIIRRNF